jgi:hypothetical protein
VILYTPLDLQAVFPADAPAPVLRTVLWNRRPCVIRQTLEGSWQVERLLSTDPRDYLDPRYHPATQLGWPDSLR